MTELVPPPGIEEIVGVSRHHNQHWGRAVSVEGRVYILHSQECLDGGLDLRDCVYSLALDNGIDVEEWVEDLPVQLDIVDARLRPVDERRCVMCGCTDERACEGGCSWVSLTICSACNPIDRL